MAREDFFLAEAGENRRESNPTKRPGESRLRLVAPVVTVLRPRPVMDCSRPSIQPRQTCPLGEFDGLGRNSCQLDWKHLLDGPCGRAPPPTGPWTGNLASILAELPAIKIMKQINEASPGWCVVGGGMMGLGLALKLAKDGQKVTVLEAADRLGGLADAWELGDVQWDRLYHVILLSDSALRRVLDELELDREIRWVETKTGFYSGGKFHSLSSSLEFLRFPVLNLYQKFRLGSTIFFGSKIRDWRKMEQIGVETWLRRWSGNSTFEKIWRPLLQAKLGDAWNRVSAGFIWSYIARMYKARQTGLKKEMFGYVPGGYRRILAALSARLESLGVTIRTSAAVQQVDSSPAGGVEVRLQDGQQLQFDRLIFTTPAGSIARACPNLDPDEQERLRGVEYLGVVCASLLMKKPLSRYYVTNITDRWVPLTGIIEMTTIVDPAELKGHSLVYLPKYVLASDDAAFREDDASIRARLIGTLEKMYPDFRADQVVGFGVARARQVMALPTIGFSTRLPPARTSLPGVFIIHSGQIVKGNLNVNETLELADELYAQWVVPELQADSGPRRGSGARGGSIERPAHAVPT